MHPLDFSDIHPMLDLSWIDPRTWHNELPPDPMDEDFIGPPTFDQDIMEGGKPTWWLIIPIGYLIYKKYI